jgi:uncharacterized membrane protein YqjE
VDRVGVETRRRRTGTPALLGEIGSRMVRLAQTEVELAGAELASDLRAGRRLLVAFGIALVAALVGVTLLMVTVVLALALVMPGWLAGLILSLVVLALAAGAAYLGWRDRPRSALTMTRRSLKEDWEWLKSQL